ncbi:hypothetical protein LDENG_00277570, partial [Lucifuga dentata]
LTTLCCFILRKRKCNVSFCLNRSTRHADGLFTSGYSRLLGQLTAKDYLDSLVMKRLNSELSDGQHPAKRHSDAVFTDNYSRYRKQMAAKKYLNSMLTGKRSVDHPAMLEVSLRSDSAPSQTAEEAALQDIIDQLMLDV